MKLVPVMTAATNTGISTTPAQCVFHVTVKAGAGGVPAMVTDMVGAKPAARKNMGLATSLSFESRKPTRR